MCNNVEAFKKIRKGDVLKVGNFSQEMVVLGDPFYNSDCDEPGWEVETTWGFISIQNEIEIVAHGSSMIDRITARLVNVNAEGTDGLPCTQILKDMKLVYMCDGRYVTDDDLRANNIALSSLYLAAIKHMPKYSFTSMFNYIISKKLDGTEIINNGSPMYILSNMDGNYGAIEMLNAEILNSLYDVFGKFFILPSSVHEVLIVMDTALTTPSELVNMVNDVNTTVVKHEDLLSFEVYTYDPVNGLTIAI